MDPIEVTEQDANEDALEQDGPSSKSLGSQSSFSNPFEALLKSSSDDDVKAALSSIFRIDADSANRISREEVAPVFNTFRHTYLQARFETEDGTEVSERLSPELLNLIESIRRDHGNVVLDMGPAVTTWSKSSVLEEMESRDGLGPLAFLSHRLCYSYVWMFRYDGNRTYERFSDVQMKVMSPLMFAALTSKPDIVHFLMKFGTRFLDEIYDVNGLSDTLSMRTTGMRALLSNIVTELFDSEFWDSDALMLKGDFTSLPEGLRSKCLKFRILLRCDPNPYVTTVKLARMNDLQSPPLPEMNVLRHIYDSLFPDLGLGLFNPPRLQHMCRCVIRRRLHENWQLPDGISQLELPKILCDYVNLLDD